MADILRTAPSYVAALPGEVQMYGCEAEFQILLRQLSQAFNWETTCLSPHFIEEPENND